MAKHFVAAAFSAAVFLLLPPADLTRAEAWMTVALMYVTGLAIACWAEEKAGKISGRKEGKR